MLTDLGGAFLPWLDEVALVKAGEILDTASGVLWDFHRFVRSWRRVLEL